MNPEQNKLLVRRLVDAVNHNNLDALGDIAGGEIARAARQWIGPFRESFPDFTMAIVKLIAEGEHAAAHFKCSGTHLGQRMGHPPTGRRFQGIDGIYISRVIDGKLAGATAVEDNLARMRQLGLHAEDRQPARTCDAGRQ